MFPFMSKGHTIPLLHFAKLIHRHRPLATITIFTTLANEPFISSSLSSLSPQTLNIISLPFPTTIDDNIPPGVESTDKLPSISLFYSFANATEQLQPHFETALERLQNDHNNPAITFLISDGFLHWTQQSASKFNIPRLVFYGFNNYCPAILRAVGQKRLLSGPEEDDELIEVPDFPWIRITRNDFDDPFNLREPNGPKFDFVMKCAIADFMSYGCLINSFYELESKFVDHLNSKSDQLKYWSVGPCCLVERPSEPVGAEKPSYMEWLDKKWAEGRSVLCVAFGTQADISDEQLKEIAIGLEKSGVDFLWALRIKPAQERVLDDGFEERVKERGLVVRGWVEQRMILEHESVQGFMSHCGWNSVLESICASVPILAFPMMADQHLNARMVVEEIKIGLRVETCDGSVRGFVKWKALSKMVRELLEGETGKALRRTVKEISEVAYKAVEEGGSSWLNLELLLNELETVEKKNHKNDMLDHEKGSFHKTTMENETLS